MAKSVHFRHNVVLGLVLTAFVVLSAGYSIAIPPGEGVDETLHLEYVKYMKERRALPIQPLSREEGVEVWMGHHPPLYYLLGGLAISWVDTSDFAQVLRFNRHFAWDDGDRNGWNVVMHFGQDRFPWKGSILAMHIVRLMTVGLGTSALYAIYRATQLLFPDHVWAPLGATTLIGFNPSFVYMSSTVHHDTLQAAVYALATWWALRFLKGPDRKHDPWLGGLLLGAALMTKASGLALVPVLGLVLLLRAWRSRDWRRLPSQALATFTVAALVAGWWFVRNQWLYGDPLGWRMHLNLYRHVVRSNPSAWKVFLVDDFLAQLGHTFWGAFGYMHIAFPEVTKYLWYMTALAGIGWIVGLLRGRLIVREHWPEWIVLSATLLLLLASFVRFALAFRGAGHGRYLFPAGASIGALLIAGLNGFTVWRHHRFISIVAALGMAAYAVWLPAKHVLPKYDPPETATADQLAKAEPAKVVLADTIALVGYKSDRLARPGQRIRVTLYWQAVGSPDERLDPLVRLQATDEGGSVLASYAHWPVPSLSPDVWSPGVVYLSRVSLGMPIEGLTGRVGLRVGAFLKGGGDHLSARDASGNLYDDGWVTIGDILSVGAVAQVPLDSVPNRRQEVLGSTIALSGFELPTDPISRGTVVPVSLYWHVVENPPADYTVFIHVLNDRGELVTQFDQPPGGGSVPTSTWQEGQTFHDAYPVPIPPHLPVGTYTVRVGMYTWPSLERLPVRMGDQVTGDHVVLGDIEIREQ